MIVVSVTRMNNYVFITITYRTRTRSLFYDDNLRSPPLHETRAAEGQDCPCTVVCEIAKCNLVLGRFSGTPPLPEKYWTKLFPEVPYPSIKNKSGTGPGVESRCSQCHSVVGKGRTHKCSKSKMQDNLHKLVKQMSLKSKEKIGGKVLKSIFEDKKAAARVGTILLATGVRNCL